MSARERLPYEFMDRAAQQEITTTIDGSLDPEVVERAVGCYIDGLTEFVFPSNGRGLESVSRLPQDIRDRISGLKPCFEKRAKEATTRVSTVISEINIRAEELRGERFAGLQQYDRSLWARNGENGLIFGVLACVDRGIPSSAVVGVEGAMGRTLGGDIEIDFIPSQGEFVLMDSAFSKKLIHSLKQGYVLVEPVLEHTGCGRRGQIMTNEFGSHGIPKTGTIIDNVRKTSYVSTGDSEQDQKALKDIQKVWYSYPRDGQGVKTPDGGLWAGVVTKLAQRAALYETAGDKMISPVEIYDKVSGDLLVGVDALDSLSDARTLESGGYTPDTLQKLISDGKVFSFKRYKDLLEEELATAEGLPKKGARQYQDIQTSWLDVEEELVNITAALWESFEKGNGVVYEMGNAYLDKALAHISTREVPDKETRRLLHHMFHTYAYAYLLNTLEVPHVPGAHHIESYLTTGDHSIGERKTVGLGQGDLARPTSAEILTGRSVLMHSKGLRPDEPIAVVIKLDTRSESTEPVSNEETGVALNDFREMLDLWPYILVGDMVPVIAIRGKSGERAGGISRVPLSVVQSFKNFAVLLEKNKRPLPDYVNATTSDGKVVLVEAVDILRIGIDHGEDLSEFRKRVQTLADEKNNARDQERFLRYSNAA